MLFRLCSKPVPLSKRSTRRAAPRFTRRASAVTASVCLCCLDTEVWPTLMSSTATDTRPRISLRYTERRIAWTSFARPGAIRVWRTTRREWQLISPPSTTTRQRYSVWWTEVRVALRHCPDWRWLMERKSRKEGEKESGKSQREREREREREPEKKSERERESLGKLKDKERVVEKRR